MMSNWGSNNYATYILLQEEYAPSELEAQMPEFLNRHIQSNNPDVQASDWTRLNLWPLTSIHLHSHLDTELESNGNITLVIIYAGIAVFILLIACINFMNLSTARSIKRSKEVGLRKVMGASIKDIRILLNSGILRMVLIAFAFSIPLAWCGMNKWLSTFAYHTNVRIVTLILSGIIAFLIALITVSYKTWRSANTGPAITLKYE
jgi:putative ABC transport system permease protein